MAESSAPAAAASGGGQQLAEAGAAAAPRRVIRRPTAVTRHGIRQFVETGAGLRLFLQNCVATVNLRTQPDLSHIATHARNAEYNPRRFSAVIMRLREPKATGLIFHSGKMVITGAKNEDDALLAARKLTRIVQRLGFPAQFTEFKIQNLVASGDVGRPIRLEGVADKHGKHCSYEPELFPGLIYRMQDPRVVILVFVSGKLVITGAKARSAIVKAATAITGVLLDFQKEVATPAARRRSKHTPTSTSIVVSGAGLSTQ